MRSGAVELAVEFARGGEDQDGLAARADIGHPAGAKLFDERFRAFLRELGRRARECARDGLRDALLAPAFAASARAALREVVRDCREDGRRGEFAEVRRHGVDLEGVRPERLDLEAHAHNRLQRRGNARGFDRPELHRFGNEQGLGGRRGVRRRDGGQKPLVGDAFARGLRVDRDKPRVRLDEQIA